MTMDGIADQTMDEISSNLYFKYSFINIVTAERLKVDGSSESKDSNIKHRWRKERLQQFLKLSQNEKTESQREETDQPTLRK